MKLTQFHRLHFLPLSAHHATESACLSTLSLQFHSEFMIASSSVPTQQQLMNETVADAEESKVCEQNSEEGENNKSSKIKMTIVMLRQF